MCLVKRPKIKEDASGKERDPPILRNPFLDGLGSAIQSIRIGRNSLRIDRNMDARPGVFVGGGSGGGSSGGSTGSTTTYSGGGGGSSTRDGFSRVSRL